MNKKSFLAGSSIIIIKVRISFVPLSSENVDRFISSVHCTRCWRRGTGGREIKDQ